MQPVYSKNKKSKFIEGVNFNCIFDKTCPNFFFKTIMMNGKESFGEHIRKLREQSGLPLRKVAATLDIDP